MARIASAVDLIKSRIDEHLNPVWVAAACESAGHVWRDRELDPATTLRLFALQVLHGNVACRAMRHIGSMRASATAYCKARTRLPVDVFGVVCALATAWLDEATVSSGVAAEADRLWHGHRVWMVDGTGVSMPDTAALQAAFGQPAGMKEGCGFPMMHVLMLMDAATGFIGDFVMDRWNTHDVSQAPTLHASMGDGDVLVGDRAFGSYAHFALVLQGNLHLVTREHQRRKPPAPGSNRARRKRSGKRQRGRQRVTMRLVRKLGPGDQLVELDRPKKKPTWMSHRDFEQLPAKLTLRRVSYRVRRPGCRTTHVTLTTTLLDPRKYTRHNLAELYEARWRIETNFRHLKTTMGMDVLRCKSPDGVTKELWVYVLVYNLVRRVMLEEARRRGVPPDRVSFIDTLDALRHGDGLGGGWDLVLNPHRPGRHRPRVLKRRKDRYTYMTKPPDQLQQTLGITRVAG